MIRPGSRVDRYEIVSEIGRGGMAIVWAARHATLGTRHALKVISSPRRMARARALREGRIAARLSHPNVVPVTEVLELGGGAVALVMPLVDGPSLEQLLVKVQPSPDEILALFRAICAGVAHAHAAGVVHRDLKPGNVLIAVAERVVPRVADFGLVKELRPDPGVALTLDGMAMGTPNYMAPEQFADAAGVDQRADVYGLGGVLHALVTGRAPFAGADPFSVRDAVLAGERLEIELPRRWQGLVDVLLAADPADRPADAQEVLAMLAEVHGDPLGSTGALYAAAQQAPLSLVSGDDTFALDGPPHNLLPAQDAFVGREEELERLAGMLTPGRLLTLVGAPGAGKTRLGMMLARRTLANWPGGAWFSDLSVATDVDGIAQGVALALDLGLGDHPIEEVGRSIAARGPVLLLLDNFEQVADHGHATVGRWRELAPDAAFLVTSREPLRLTGEGVVPVAPLAKEEAVALFVERAREVNPAFDHDAHRQDIEWLVELLDRLPLAIELAAARARALTPAAFLSRMERRFELLRGRRRDVSARQRTLRGALDWSWDLLGADEKNALAQISIFAGGFSLDAAEAVLHLGEDAWVPDVLEALVDRSLLRSWTPPGVTEPLFGAYASVRAYAAEKLEDATIVEKRHGDFYARYGEKGWSNAFRGPLADPLRRQFALEVDDVLAALRRALARGDVDVAVHAYLAARNAALQRGPTHLADAFIEPVLALVPADHDRRFDIELSQATLARRTRGTEAALALLDDLLPRAPNQAREGQIHYHLAVTYHEAERNAESRPHLRQALACFEASGQRSSCIGVRNALGVDAQTEGRFSEAYEHLNAALALLDEVGDSQRAVTVLSNLGVVDVETGRVHEAVTHFEQALEAARLSASRALVPSVYNGLASALVVAGNFHDAADRIAEGTALAHAIRDDFVLSMLKVNAANIARYSGKADEALRLYQEVLDSEHGRGSGFLHCTVARSLGELLLDDLDDLPGARAMLEEAAAVAAESRRPGVQAGAQAALALVLQRLGDPGVDDQLAEAEAVLVDRDAGPDEGYVAARRVAVARLRDEPVDRWVAEAEAVISRLQLGRTSPLARCLAQAIEP